MIYFNMPVSLPVDAPIEISTSTVPVVPFFSQFLDVQALNWQKKSCGIASLAMIIEYYKPGIVSVNKLLDQGIAEGAYLQNAGWIHKDLALLSEKYGLIGKNYDLFNSDKSTAFVQFKEFLKDGPVIASIYYKFDPKSTIPHLVVINGIKDGVVYYNDPSGQVAGEKISIANFLAGWKKRFIVVRPAVQENDVAVFINKFYANYRGQVI